MAAARLLYFNAANVTLYLWSNGHLREEARFAHNEAGQEAFAERVKGGAIGIYHLLVDVVEEDFTVDTIPFLRGKDRRSLLARRLAQRYRDASLSATASLGYERTQRREERVLLSAFTNIELLEPWLAILVQENVAVSG
ncbi:MAG TPA: hypothetical protein VJM53_07355, partial [Burkholderiales bacterium]|nr:hypothetical protein [Burkholderiales bacterium]